MRGIRDRFGVSQVEMAEIAGVSQATVSRWESGIFEPNRNELSLIRAEAMRREMDWDDSLMFADAPSEQAAQ